MSIIEEWLPVVGYETSYMVSDLGRIKRSEKYVPGKNGSLRKLSEMILKPNLNHRGYHYVNLSFNNIYKGLVIHRIVAKAFLSNAENKKQVNHIDGDKTNNRKSNLEWCSMEENMQHARVNNLFPQNHNCGESHGGSKLKVEQVLSIRNMYVNGKKRRVIAEFFNINVGTVSSILNRKSWKHI